MQLRPLAVNALTTLAPRTTVSKTALTLPKTSLIMMTSCLPLMGTALPSSKHRAHNPLFKSPSNAGVARSVGRKEMLRGHVRLTGLIALDAGGP